MKTTLKKALVALSLISAQVGHSQICNGTQGAPVFVEDFGTGTNAVGPQLPAGVTTYGWQSGIPTNGSYVIANTGNVSNTIGYVAAPDHTGGGYMMVVNAAAGPGESFRRRIEGLCPNTTYVFSAWLANNNLTTSTVNCSPYVAADVMFQIQFPANTTIASITTGNLPLAPTNAFVWNQYGLTFTTGGSQTWVDLILVNNAPGGCGNDYVLDDISFAPCGPGVALSSNKSSYCVGEAIALQSSFTSGSYTNPQYQWQFSNDGGATWSNITSANSANYNISSASLSNSGMYRLILSENGNINSPNCRIIAGPLSITVKECGSCCIGNACTDHNKNPLPTSWEVPLGNYNYVFNKSTSNTGRVGIGVVACSPGNLLEVNKGVSSNISGLRLTDLTTATPLTSNNRFLGVDNNGDVILMSGSGGVTNACATTNYVPVTNSSGNFACSQIYDDGTSVGIGTNTGFAYTWPGGLTGPTAPPNSGTVRLHINGVSKALAYFATSDQKFKRDITGINNALSIVRKLEGKTYYWRSEEFKDKGFSTSKQYGFIAQDLEKVMPEAVGVDENGDRSVNYDMIIPVLVQSIKEQSALIDNLQKQIDELKATSHAVGATTGNSQNINLSDKNVIVLDQNVPNPFTESTVISYNIPVDFNKAQLQFTTIDGRMIKTVDITTKGQNTVTVFASDLSSGAYMYSLIVDGKTVETKRMIKQ